MPLKRKRKRRKTPFIRTRNLNVPKGYDFEACTKYKRKGKRKVGVSFSKKLSLRQSRAIQKKMGKKA